MNTTDTSEKGLETLIMRHMTGVGRSRARGRGRRRGTLPAREPALAGSPGNPRHYDRSYALDVPSCSGSSMRRSRTS